MIRTFKTVEKSNLCQNDETFFYSKSVQICRDLQIFTGPHNDQYTAITYSELPALTKITPTNLFPEKLPQQHFTNTYTDPEGCHMSNFIRQNELNIANEPLKVQQPLLESSSEMDKLRCITNTAHSPVTIITVMGTNFPSQEF